MKIKQVHLEGRPFKIFVVIPLLPGFPGHIYEKSGNVMSIQLGYQLYTIGKGKKSLLRRLKSDGIDPEQYIRFFGLRAHGYMPNEKPVTE